MDARSERTAIPLAVDLDGTLISTDLLWEGLFLLFKKNPLFLFMVPVWLMAGPARLKMEIAARVDIDAESLPYRPDVVARLREEHAAGRKILLATGTPRKFAEAIAAHLDVFDGVLATDDAGHNLTSHRKRARLIEMFGDGGHPEVDGDVAGGGREHERVVLGLRQARHVVVRGALGVFPRAVEGGGPEGEAGASFHQDGGAPAPRVAAPK